MENINDNNLISDLLDFVEKERETERESEREKRINSLKNSKLNDKTKIEDGFFMAKCEVCSLKFKLSCRYSGEFPLCTSHRDLNSRGNLNSRNKNKVKEY